MMLETLAKKYGTDKLEHGYMPFYNKHLPINPKKMLEIGCFKGASLRLWREAFPQTELHTLDLFEEYKDPEDIKGLICHKGSESDLTVLTGLIGEEFDIIINDASHDCNKQLINFNFMFNNCMSNNGLYFMEDLQTNTEEFYREGLSFEETMLGQMKSGTFPHKFELFNDKIAVIFKHAS